MKQRSLKILLGCVVIVVACFIAYAPAIKGDFIWDDDAYVTKNPVIVAPDGLWRIWFSTDMPSQYFPLVYTTFWFEHQVWGFNPIPYHVANVIIHVVCSLLVWLILRRLSIPAAFVAAAAFALHPVNVESVAWITERKNVLMLLFSLLTLLFWIDISFNYCSRRKWLFLYTLSLFCYALALLSKTTACVLPAAMVLVLWLRHIPLKIKRLILIGPYLLMGFAMGLLTMWWEQNQQTTGWLVDIQLSIMEHFLLATRAIWFYADKIFLPVNLAFSYPRWTVDSADAVQYLWLIACILVIIFLWLLRNRLGRGPITAVIFFIAALSPMLGFITLYTFVHTWVADHYQYMASIAIITLAISAGAKLLARLGKNSLVYSTLVSAVLLLTLAVLTWRQCRIYTDSETLWRDTINKNPDSWLAHNNISIIYFRQKNTDKTIYHTNRMLELIKDDPSVHPYNTAIAYFNLAVTYRAMKQYDRAIEHYYSVLDLYPDSTKVHTELANLLELQGRLDKAIEHYKLALVIGGESVLRHKHLADALIKKGEFYKAMEHLHLGLKIKPDSAETLSSLIGLYETQSDPDIRLATNAVECAKRAEKLTNGSNPFILQILATALAADNQISAAAEVTERAIELAEAAGENGLADFCREQLQSYKE